MKILQICNKSPIPPKEGGPIAMYHLAQALISAGHNVDVLAIETPKYTASKKDIDKYTNSSYTYQAIFVDTTVKLMTAAYSFLRNAPYHVERFENNKVKKQLQSMLKSKQYDIILFETLYMTPYLQICRKFSKATCVLRSHNIEHQIWERLKNNETNLLKKLYLTQLTNALKRYEQQHLDKYDAIACISQGEVQYYNSFINLNKIKVVPFGVEIQNTKINNEINHFYHIGSMDWLPNIEGIEWLIKKVLPILQKSENSIKLFLAGRNMPEWLSSFQNEMLEVVGKVDDINTFLHDKAVLVVPLFSGSGIRIKIIEAMSLGKIIISTSLGAEGIAYQNEKNILIADTADTFAKTMIEVSQNIDNYKQIGIEAKKLIEQKHSYNNVIDSFNNLINKA